MQSPGPATAAWTPARARSAATPISAPRAPLGLRTGLVYDEVAVTEQTTVEHLDRLCRLLLRGHLDEAEAPGATGKLVRDDPDRFHRPGLREQLAQVLLGGLEGEVTYEQFCGHCPNLLPMTQRRTMRTLAYLSQHRSAQD